MATKAKEVFVLAHNIRSLYNVGSLFRTADAFGITKIYLTGYTGTPANPIHKAKIAKVALGAEDWVPWEYSKSPQAVIRVLKKQKVQVIGLENNVKAQKLPAFRPKYPALLVLGEEATGINKALLALCDKIVEIPMYGKKESLNVSVAFGVAAYALIIF